MKRRDFLVQTAAGAVLASAFPAALDAASRHRTGAGKMEKRTLGKTGEKLSIVAFGGFALNNATPQQSREWLEEAVAAGVNHFDIAPSYGNAEERMGEALPPLRDKVFLSCKTAHRKAKEASEELEKSLRQLRTERIDLYQLHAVTTMEDVETIFAADGALAAFQKAQQAGKIRHIGFSAHSVEAALALMERFDFASIMFPVNYATWHAGDFGPQVLQKATEKRMGILALKAMARRPWPENADRSAFPNCWYEPFRDSKAAQMALRFTLSHPVTTAIAPASMECFRLAVKLARDFEPLAPVEIEMMKQEARRVTPLFKAETKA